MKVNKFYTKITLKRHKEKGTINENHKSNKSIYSSPGDIAAKRNEVQETIYRWNIENTDNTKVILIPIRWETNAIPTYINNSSGQSVINKQIVENSDILLAIFGHKLGSPVDNYRSKL